MLTLALFSGSHHSLGSGPGGVVTTTETGMGL